MMILIEICPHTFHLTIPKNLAFRALGTGFNHIYRLQPKLTIDAFHPLSVWTLLLELHIALSMRPLSMIQIWVISWDHFENILLSDVRHHKFTSHFFRCWVSCSFTALLSSMLYPRRFAPRISHIFGFVGVPLRLIVSLWFVLADEFFPVLPSLFFLQCGFLLLFLNSFQILPWFISPETCLFLAF